MTTINVANTPPDETNEQVTQRRHKLQQLRSQGYQYPNQFRRKDWAKALLDTYQSETAEQLQEQSIETRVAGRIMTRRVMGQASFVHLQDMTGRIQIYLRQDELPAASYSHFLEWDLGDIIGVTGTVFKTRTGELSIRAKQVELLTKTLRPLPEKFHGLVDQETRFRQRYLDLLVNPETQKIFQIRSRLIEELRNFFTMRQFLEVETPMMQPIPGGATARPFITHHNTFDIPLYLRIAPELYLKRLVVGGIERVFEINRNFRNEGISVRHNPEFTMLEFYQAYADFHDLMDLTEELFSYLAQKVLGVTTLDYQGLPIDLAQPFVRLTMQDAITTNYPDLPRPDFQDLTAMRNYAEQLGVAIETSYGTGKIQAEIFEKLIEKKLQQPTFITAYPTEISPLARPNDQDPTITDRFELFIGGREIANGFSELNDPELQAQRFLQQVAELERGDQEAMHYDVDYITALEHGLPPTAGEGIGIDRLAMLFTNTASIREVILFPLLRPCQQ